MVRPKKHLGQHFLTDKSIAKKIADAVSENTENLIEIGPGKGILTEFLMERNFQDFRLVEIDSESVEYLNANYPALQDKIIQADFLRIDLKNIFKKEFSIVGNFPYNISTQILFRVLENREVVPEVVGMFQKEVAERIASPPGSKKYGILSVLLQAFYTIHYLFTVNPGVFFPPPQVKSGVIKLTRNTRAQLDCDEKLFFEVVKTAFNQRRKTLRNSLKPFTISGPAIEILHKRPEQLTVEEFVLITNNLKK